MTSCGAAPGPSVAVQNQDAELGIGRKFSDPDGLAPQYPFRVPRRVLPAPEPHYLGGRAYCCGQLVEVGVGAHDDEVRCLGKLLYLAIRTFEQVGLCNMSRLRLELSEPDDEFAREVLVKQQFHRATRLPILAANSYTARKSSASSSG